MSSDAAKINNVIGLLHGKVLAWAQASSPHLSDHLFMIQQESRSVAEYAIEFGTLVEEAVWNEPALLSAFHRGLSGSARERLLGGRS